jgi:ribosome maturation factor RimP
MFASSAIALALCLPARPTLPTVRVPGCFRMLCAPTEMPASLPAGFAEVWKMLQSAANDEAAALGMTIDKISFARGKLTVLAAGGDSDALEALNRRLGDLLDEWEQGDGSDKAGSAQQLPAYVLEVASPGLSDVLQSVRDFQTFKGFEVTATLSAEFKKTTVHRGTLLGARRPAAHWRGVPQTLDDGMSQAAAGGGPLRARLGRESAFVRPTCCHPRSLRPVHSPHTLILCVTLLLLLLWLLCPSGRDDESVLLNLKGRVLKLPRDLVLEVRLPSALSEPGDPY